MDVRKVSLSALTDNINHNVDVFICCGSYEDRCRCIADRLNPAQVSRAIVVENKNLSAYVGTNARYLRSRFGPETIDVATDSTNALQSADNIRDAVRTVVSDNAKRFLVDITTFRHESLLILVNLLRVMTGPDAEITLAYVSAEDYSVGDELKDKWLSKGVAGIRNILGYGGDVSPSRPMHMIVLVGFEYQRASRLIDIVEPNVLSLGYGAADSATAAKHVASQEFFYKLLKMMVSIHANVNDFSFACNDPIETKTAILGQIEKYQDYNTVLVPMNTKLSTIGAALAAFERPDIQICYAEAMLYNYHHYSSPGSTCYLMKLDLHRQD